MGWTALTAQERHCPLLRGGESEVISRRKGVVLPVHILGLLTVVWQRADARQKYNWGRSVGTLFCARHSVEDTAVPAASREVFLV